MRCEFGSRCAGLDGWSSKGDSLAFQMRFLYSKPTQTTGAWIKHDKTRVLRRFHEFKMWTDEQTEVQFSCDLLVAWGIHIAGAVCVVSKRTSRCGCRNTWASSWAPRCLVMGKWWGKCGKNDGFCMFLLMFTYVHYVFPCFTRIKEHNFPYCMMVILCWAILRGNILGTW